MLYRKMMRDIRKNKAQFIAIFLMIFLGVFIYAGVNSEWNGMQVNSSAFYEETNMGDVFVYGNHFTQEEVNKLSKCEEIQGVERRAVFTANVKNQDEKRIVVNIVGSNKISAMKRMSGEPYEENKKGIWLDHTYALKNHIKIGDSMTLTMQGMEFTETVKGTILHPEYVYQIREGDVLPDHENNGYVFLSQKYFPYADAVPYTQLLLKSKNPTSMERIVCDCLQRSNLTFVNRKDLTSTSMLESEITQHQAFGEVFPIVFLLIAVLTTLTTVSKMIINQRLQIGILKALGFSNLKIKVHYLSHVMIIAIIGAILGYLTGPLIVPALLYPMMEAMYILPQWQAIHVQGNLIMVAGSIILCFLAAYYACHQQLKEKAVDLLRPAINNFSGHQRKHGNIWKSLNFYVQWNMRDILRNKLRSLIAVLGVAGCSGLMLCAFSLQDSMHQMMNQMFQELQTYEMRVQVDEHADIASIKQRIQGCAIQEGAVELKHKESTQMATLLVQEDNRYLKLQNEELKNTALPKSGVALSYKLAESYGWMRNDTITWRVVGSQNWHESTIKEIIHTPASQGLTMSVQEFNHAQEPFVVTSIVGKREELSDLTGIQNVQYMEEDIEKGFDAMMEGMNLIIVILILAAVVLGIVVLYNIGTFSYMEKTYDMATLKVLGFHDRQVKKLLRQQNVWLTCIGIIFGFPFGYGLIYTVLSTVGDTMDIQITISWLTYIGCAVGTLTVSMLVMRLVSRKIKDIDMVSALKAMD